MQDGFVLQVQISGNSAENWQSLLHDTQYVLDQSQIQFAHGNLHYYFTLRVTSFFPQACNPCERCNMTFGT